LTPEQLKAALHEVAQGVSRIEGDPEHRSDPLWQAERELDSALMEYENQGGNMATYMIEVNEEQRKELARLVKADYFSTKKTFGALPVGVELQGEAEELHKQIVNATVKETAS
jgi:hypothetical protein